MRMDFDTELQEKFDMMSEMARLAAQADHVRESIVRAERAETEQARLLEELADLKAKKLFEKRELASVPRAASGPRTLGPASGPRTLGPLTYGPGEVPSFTVEVTVAT